MAWMNQEKKAKIAAALKKVMPKDWKYSLAVRNNSTICLTIAAAPVDLIAACKNKCETVRTHLTLNECYLERAFDGEILTALTAAKDALNLDNFDKSDIQTDYFHVGHYIEISLGRWDKPFKTI